ncbi:MAG: ATP-dependent RecD-like DNA helicase [Candidatus Sumerlaeota bacterium]|nr:ATP-dependent RecD-like DNA helicase [Candidatus Sumerlaeota bacterium]
MDTQNAKPDTENPPAGESIVGVFEKVVFANSENGYTVAAFRPEGATDSITVVGNLFGANVGETLKLTGSWKANMRFGQQFKADSFVPILPTNAEAIEHYLASGLISGIGKEFAKRIVRAFGRDTLDIVDKDPDRLREVDGIGPTRLQRIKATWTQQKAIREVIIFLQRYGISPAWAIRLYKVYGEQAPAVLRADPFRLALEVHGIGFKSADQIARATGIAPDDPKRIQAAVKHRLAEYANDGHTFAPYDLLESETAEMLSVEAPKVREAIVQLYKEESIVCEKLPEGDKAVYDSPLYRAETRVAEALRRLVSTPKNLPRFDIPAAIADFEREFRFAFASRQRQALELAFRGGVMVLTGGPGTGKTTTLRGIIHVLSRRGVSIALAAPTGRAAKRLAETTLMDASTIHRLLKFNPQKGAFAYDDQHPLPADLVVIDETSMMDIALAHHLLKAVRPQASVLFVGDSDQLPSVGPGNFLADLVASKAMPVVRLNEIFRQARSSLIVVNAHRINQGEFPIIKASEDFPHPDFFFISKDDPQDVLETIKDLARDRIPRKFGLDPTRDIQVITPMRRGDLGVARLNEVLQQMLNPEKRVFMRGRSAFKPGDKVMQVRNNYDREVFNGDIGRIAEIDEERQTLTVVFDGRGVIYPFDDLDDLTLAYAITVHKSQGSEYPAVILPMHTQHYILLQRNLFYTALTRGKKLVCVVGSRRALGIAVNNAKIAGRFSGLRQRLRV